MDQKIKSGFLCTHDYEGEKDFDQTYKEVQIKKRVKKIGDSDEDFIIEEYEIVKETPIQEVLDAQRDEVGIDAYLKPYIMSGEDLPEVNVDMSAPINDFTGFPEDPADVAKLGDDMLSAWNSLDPILRGDCETPEEFLKSLTEEKLKDYYDKKLNAGKVVNDEK